MPFFSEQIQKIKSELSSKEPTHLIFLNGPLGAGKTTFVQEFVASLSKEEVNVQSPTFLKVLSYKFASHNILHIDAYRVEEADEFERMSLDSYGDLDYIFVEWPELFHKFLEENPHMKSLLGISIILNVEIDPKDSKREFKFSWL